MGCLEDSMAAVEHTPEQPPPSFSRRFVGMIVSPREVFAGLTDGEAWFWPAVMLLVGYTVYLLPAGLGSARWMGDTFAAMLQSPSMAPTTADPSSAKVMRFMVGFMPIAQVFSAMWQVPLYVALTWATRTGIFYGLARAFGGEKVF